MPLADYLASKYLNAETTAPTKKRKRSKQSSKASGLIIADDDALGWNNKPENAEDDEGLPVVASTGSAEFRRAKKSSWKVVGSLAPKDTEQAQADAIIAAASAENAAAAQEDEAPAIVDDGIVRMESGAHAGLQSAADVTRQFEEQQRKERAQFEAEEREGKVKGKNQAETVYRDATGRRIDISMRRAEARREADKKIEEEKEKLNMQKGDVQLREKEKRKEELDEARFMKFARTADDEDLNKELRERERWNDPAAQFLTQKKDRGGGGKEAGTSGKKVYKGAAMPNRYGIRPGHRWDGVDRSNGWEGERFKAINRKTRNKDLDFAWQMDT